MKKYIKPIALAALAALIIIQFFQIEKTNPESNSTQDIFVKHAADDALVSNINEACYDCHSNHSEFPWYTYVQPVGWWINGHIKNARKHLNFSEFVGFDDKKAKHKLDECIEYVEEGKMPLASFKLTHPEARITDTERATMVAWFKEMQSSYE